MKPGKPLQRKTAIKARAATVKRSGPLKAKADKPKRSTIVHRQEVRAERTIHREETTEIYEAVAERACGMCECTPGCTHPAEQMDHALGRTHAAQTVQNCWLLSAAHHLEKTENRPSRLVWLERFHVHCLAHRYEELAAEVWRSIEALRLKAALPVR